MANYKNVKYVNVLENTAPKLAIVSESNQEVNNSKGVVKNNNMCEELRILYLLLRKNLLVRKRHFIGSIIELLLPLLIIVVVLVIRSNYDVEPIHVTESTYFPVLTKADLTNHIPRSMLQLYYKPKNDFTKKLMAEVTRCTKLPDNQLFGFETEDDMLQNYEIQQGKDELMSVLAIDFDNTDSVSPKKLSYTIRSSQPIPSKLFESDFEGNSSASDKLIQEIPVVILQMCLNDEFIKTAAPDSAIKPTVVIQKLPYPPYDNVNSSELLIQNIICMLGILIFFAPIYLIPSYISAEKITGVNTLLKVNGVKPYQNFLSWLVSGMLFGILAVSAVTTIVKLNFMGQKALYEHSNSIIIWLSLFVNVTHIYAFCLDIASFFSKTWLAQIVATTLPVIIYIIATQLEDTPLFFLVPRLGIFCPTVATTRIFDELNKRENGITGAQWGNLFETVHPALSTEGSLGFMMIFGVVGTLLHFISALFGKAVLTILCSCLKSLCSSSKNYNKVCNSDNVKCEGCSEGRPEILEYIAPNTLNSGVCLKNLAKCFKGGFFNSCKIDAIRGVSMDFYKGQITALLGHNGAGKTTTFSILTGLTPPSQGSVSINGIDISHHLDAVRSDLGVCPQENIMFPDLTVHEQLQFIGQLKKKDKPELTQQVDNLLKKLGISEKRDVMPDKLSGGQKRRVCLGMALIGDASTIFLDEPTSGMDPETSRGIWDILLQYRKKKTIIITTHSMEEADILGDRIAIMHAGQLKCYGTPMFLKKHFGHHYYDVTLSTTPLYNERKIQEIVGSEAKMNVMQHGRIVVCIPFTSSLPEILDNLEQKKAELGITGVSVSTITLEQVFLKAAEDEESIEFIDDVDSIEQPVAKGYKCLTGWELTRQKISALLTKKMTYVTTNSRLYWAIILGTFIAVLLPEIFYCNNHKKVRSTPVNLGLYQSPEALIYSEDPILGDTYKKIIEQQGGVGILTKANLSSELLSRAVVDLASYKSRMIISAEFSSNTLANGLYSGGMTFSAPITVNTMSNLVLQRTAGAEYSIVANIGDLPRALTTNAMDKMLTKFNIMTKMSLFMTIFFHIVALFVKHPLLESSTKVKQLQQMTGVSPFLYWGTMFLFDYLFYIIVTLITVFGIGTVNFFAQSNAIRSTEIGILLLLFALFGISALLLAYIHSFIGKQFHTVYSILSGVPLLLVIVTILLHETLPFIEDAKNVNIIQRRIFSMEPHVSFVFAYLKFAEIAADNARCRGLSNRLNHAACVIGDPCCDMRCSDGNCANPLPYLTGFRKEGGIEEFLMYLLLTPFILAGILCFLEQRVVPKLRSKLQLNKGILWLLFTCGPEKFRSLFGINKPKSIKRNKVIDSEVQEEKSIVCQAINQRLSKPDYEDKNVFMTSALRKRYGNLEAVKEVNFRVMENECFGLLGVNGAGKSTTFRMLVGEEIPTSGILYRGSHNIKTNRTEYLAGMGYCPQTDALVPYFNAVEHLSLFARLRGVPSSQVALEVHSWIDKMGLTEHARNASGCYSGGNKRRLNIAIALIASPKLVLLDEPTTGVDPKARRLVRNVLKSCQTSGQAIILTSHSMAECEVLCNRLVIMMEGRLLCIGASQELKERFGAGYNISVKLNPGRLAKDFVQIRHKIQETFVGELMDEHPGHLFYHITDSEATWVKMFRTMNNLKSEYECIEDFTVSTSTLEQLFMQFARSSADHTAESDPSSQSNTEVNTLDQKAEMV